MAAKIQKLDDTNFIVTDSVPVTAQKTSAGLDLELDRHLSDLEKLKIRHALELAELNRKIADIQGIKKLAADAGVVFAVAQPVLERP